MSAGSILPTCLELAGLDVPATDFPSLAPVLNGGEPEARPIVSEIDFGIWGYRDGDRYAMIRDGDWKLAVFRDEDRFPDDDGIMLHHLPTDPGERRNLARDPGHAATVRRLLRQLDGLAG